MATTRKQKIAIQKTLENGGNITQAMREAGYSEATINNPSNLTSSKGYKEALHEAGLTEDLITKSLVEDIQNNPGDRFSELALGAELLGMRKMGVNIANNIVQLENNNIIHTDPRVQEKVDKILREYVEREY